MQSIVPVPRHFCRYPIRRCTTPPCRYVQATSNINGRQATFSWIIGLQPSNPPPHPHEFTSRLRIRNTIAIAAVMIDYDDDDDDDRSFARPVKHVNPGPPFFIATFLPHPSRKPPQNDDGCLRYCQTGCTLLGHWE